MRRWACALFVATLAHNAFAADSLETPDAGSRTVVLIRPVTPDPVTTEAAARVEGELHAAGFHVEIVAPTGDDPRRDLETAGSAEHPIAAFAIVVHPTGAGSATAEIWVSDRLKQTTVIQRAELTGANRARQAEILAVRALEFLKASLAELWIEPAPHASAPPPAPEEPSPTPPRHVEAPSAPPRRVAFGAGPGIGIGVGVLDGLGMKSAAWSPAVIVSYGWESGLILRLDLHGLGPATNLRAASGTASVEEQFGTLDVMKTFWPRWPVVPFLCAGIGAQHVHVAGQASAPYAGATADYWSPSASAGLGAAVPVHAGISVVVSARGSLAFPPAEVLIAQADAGTFGGPSMLFDAHVLGVFP